MTTALGPLAANLPIFEILLLTAGHLNFAWTSFVDQLSDAELNWIELVSSLQASSAIAISFIAQGPNPLDPVNPVRITPQSSPPLGGLQLDTPGAVWFQLENPPTWWKIGRFQFRKPLNISENHFKFNKIEFDLFFCWVAKWSETALEPKTRNRIKRRKRRRKGEWSRCGWMPP